MLPFASSFLYGNAIPRAEQDFRRQQNEGILLVPNSDPIAGEIFISALQHNSLIQIIVYNSTYTTCSDFNTDSAMCPEQMHAISEQSQHEPLRPCVGCTHDPVHD